MPKDVNSTPNLSENLGENSSDKAPAPCGRGFGGGVRQHEIKSTSLNSAENTATPSLREIEQGEISKQSTTPNNSNSWIASSSATHFPRNDSEHRHVEPTGETSNLIKNSLDSSPRFNEAQNDTNFSSKNSMPNSSTNANFMDCHENSANAKFSRNDGTLANSAQIPSVLGAQPKAKPKLAIVVPCYNEEAVIEISFAALYAKLTQLIADGLVSRESFLCFVDDGSKDRTCEILCRLKKERGLQSGGFSRDVANLRVNSTTPSLRGDLSPRQSTSLNLAENPHTPNSVEQTPPPNPLPQGEGAFEVNSAQNAATPSLRGSRSEPWQSTTPNDLNSWIASSSATHFPRNDGTLANSALNSQQNTNLNSHTNSTENLNSNAEQTPPPNPLPQGAGAFFTQNSQQTNPPQVRIVKLSKNYGQQNALLAGLEYVASFCDAAISVDADLQDDINAMDAMVRAFGAGAHIVYGARSARHTDSFFKRRSALAFYKLMRFMGVDMQNNAYYMLLSARAIGDLLEFKEVNLFLRGIVPLVGLKSEVVHYERLARAAGETKYPLTKLLALAWEAITSFSIMPLRCLSVLGLCMFVAAAVYGGYALWVRLFNAQTMSGWTSTILIVLIFGGMQFLSLGLIGEYVGKIYQEVKKRPRYFVERVE